MYLGWIPPCDALVIGPISWVSAAVPSVTRETFGRLTPRRARFHRLDNETKLVLGIVCLEQDLAIEDGKIRICIGREHADVGYESKACLIPPGWCFSTRRRSARI
jgi:hypothetical protein